ncbi:ATP-binding protein [Actinoplanes derwentensis]|uniref:AAA ATPase domain-containing protein n=1 Tax=Actinoplanes derwentensis TaxID=113562 RepID=A0A1H1X2F7_9ACTN|nr:AAA family ATPase [Actinoplanes derwentensis]GID85761.1 LuxR family transcriptional regulator [Actinoplanes derwentensis]SDT02806.1 AAA ATPase domain-containing protein [Actinoplanes derwentensis]
MSQLTAFFALPTPGPFVGRHRLLGILRAELGRPSALVLLSGEAGVGKSRLVVESLQDTGLPVVVAHCDDLREPQPLGPLIDGLRVAQATGTLPALPQWPPPTAPLPDPDAERARLLRAAAALLSTLAPVALAVEDLQMADPATLQLLDHLAAHPVPGLTVVITVRGNELPAGWQPGPAVRRLRVPPLTRAEVGRLAAALLADSGAVGFATHLYERTAGIPFLVEEVVRSLRTDGDVEAIRRHPDALADLAVPALLRDVLVARLHHLDEATREILGAAAVLGQAADPHPLATIMQTSEGTITAALQQAKAAGLLHQRDGRLWFRHTLARQVVHELLPPVTRRLLHLRTARLFEQQQPRPYARLAHHYREAGSPADHVRNAEAAADLATARGDDGTAARFLLGAVGHPGLPRPIRVRLAGKLGRSAIESVAQTSAIPVLRDLVADRRLPPGARGELGLALGRMLRQQGEARAGYEQIERAVPYLRQHGRRARALAVLSAPDTVVDRHLSEHQARCEQAALAAAESGEPSAVLAVEIARLSLLLESGDPTAGPAVTAAAAGLAGHPREHARACLNWAQGALHVGDATLAATMLATGRRLVDDADYERLRPLVELTTYALDLATDRRAGLEQRLLRFLAQPHRLPLAMPDARLYLARLRHRQGDLDAAEQGLREVITEADRVGAAWPLIPARTALAELLLTRGARAEGRAEAMTALALVRAKGLPAWGHEATRLLT